MISTTFPSQLPFWIELQGLPMHFWKKHMVYKIGEELGLVLDHEITPAAAKIKVQINGLEPITLKIVVEFSDGKEALVTLEYKNLKKYCFHCQRLTHEAATCPGLLKEKDLIKQSSNLPSPKRNNFTSGHNKDYLKSPTRDYQGSHSGPNLSREDYNSNKRRYDDRELRNSTPSRTRTDSHKDTSSQRTPTRSLNYSRREPPRNMERNHHNTRKANFQWRERTRPNTDIIGSSENSRTRRPPLERESIVGESMSPHTLAPTKETVMDELREVTVQYTSCADPTESLARKQRVLQGEARGMMAETAAQILAASPGANQELDGTMVNQLPSHLPLSPDVPIHPAEKEAAGASIVKKKREDLH